MTSKQQVRPIDYSTYLRLDELLELQSPQGTPLVPDELDFIVTHQAIELWFRALVAHLRRARDLVGRYHWVEAAAVVQRMCGIIDVTIAQVSTLQKLPPTAFLQFRNFLSTASGLESIQFRELEVLSGLRSGKYIARLRGVHGELPAAVRAALAEPSLAETHLTAAAAHGISDWAEFDADVHADPGLKLLSDALLDYDNAWARWRSAHIAVVSRMLGSQVLGTAGTMSSYLERQLLIRFFPYLWDARSDLAVREGGEAAPPPNEVPWGKGL